MFLSISKYALNKLKLLVGTVLCVLFKVFFLIN